MSINQPVQVTRLERPEGSIGYVVEGSGPLIVCVPGMGDLRATYRFLAPQLVAAGFRVATVDLRGHGDSTTGFARYDDVATAGDLTALIEALGGPAVIIGNSMAAGSATIVAAERPELVSGLVLLGPFVRNPAAGRLTLALFRVMMARPWVALVWKAYLPTLYAGRRPADFEAYREQLAAALRRPGYAAAFSATTRTSHAPAEAVADRVSAPVLVVMGENDPDFSDPAAEAAWIAETMSAQVLMVPECGHYPQAQRIDVVGPAVVDFVTTLHA